MALTKKGSLAYGIGSGSLTDPSIGGLIPTSVEVTTENTVNVTAKGVTGEVTAHLFGSPKNTGRVEGYGSALVALSGDVAIGGKSMSIMRSTVTASNEDFCKSSIEAEGYVLV